MEEETDKKTAAEEVATEITPITAAELMEQLIDKASENDFLSATFMSAYVFNGKSLLEWHDYFYIKLPTSRAVIRPETMIEFHLKLGVLFQQCAYNYSVASSAATSLDAASSIRKAEVVNSLVGLYERRGGKRPGAQVLSHMADHLIDSAYGKAGSKVAKDFFREQKESLLEVRKSLEQISIMMHFEQKLQ